MKTIKFTATVQFESEGRNQGPVYAAGTTHTFDDAFADRWLNRGVAVLAPTEPAPEPVPAPEPAPEPETKIVHEYRGRRR